MTSKIIEQRNTEILKYFYPLADIEQEKNHGFVIESRMKNLHRSWDILMSMLKEIEDNEDYFWFLNCVGAGIYEFGLKGYPHLQSSGTLELPDGLYVMTDSRLTSYLDDTRREAVWKGIYQFCEWKNNLKS